METNQNYYHFLDYDLITPDGKITKLVHQDGFAEAEVLIEKIPSHFLGFSMAREGLLFNGKSTLAQLGIHIDMKEIVLDPKRRCAEVRVDLYPVGPVGKALLPQLEVGTFIGKLFAAEETRRVRDPDYLSRMFGRTDRKGRPLLLLSGKQRKEELLLEKIEGRTVALLSLLNGTLSYAEEIFPFLPTVAKGLKHPHLSLRKLLALHQQWQKGEARHLFSEELLLVKTAPLHIRTVFARVVPSMLPSGCFHTSASILQPDTLASGDVYELFGKTGPTIETIPLEFYTLEPEKEYVFFSDRDQLQECIESSAPLFDAFRKTPAPAYHEAATFIVKGTQLLSLNEQNWIDSPIRPHSFPPAPAELERKIKEHPLFPLLAGIETGAITSQGILLTRYFPPPIMKQMLLSSAVRSCLKGIYFSKPSQSHGDFFSHHDHALLLDLDRFSIPVYWVDEGCEEILKFVVRSGKESGMFVPLPKVDIYKNATIFGIYGSNLKEGEFEKEFQELMEGVMALRKGSDHEQLNLQKPVAIVTGGGPGAMAVGNRVAKNLGLLSCANIIDFRPKDGSVVNEQKTNPFIDAKMTYRLERLVERQAEFNLDFPIFLKGGIGTDFEYSLEEARRKVGASPATPCLLFGESEYWEDKITSRFQNNIKNGTIVGSEWVSNCFYAVQTAEQGLDVYRRYFSGNLPIGKNGMLYEKGFCSYSDLIHEI